MVERSRRAVSVTGLSHRCQPPRSHSQSQRDYTVVRSGDTLQRIARRHGVTVAKLRLWNQLSTDSIYEGSTLNVQPPARIRSIGQHKNRRANPETDEDLNRRTKRHLYTRQKPIRLLTNSAVGGPDMARNAKAPWSVKAAAKLTPQAQKQRAVPASTHRQVARPITVRGKPCRWLFTMPLPRGTWISSLFGPRWGSFHSGVDFAADLGTPIRAAAQGRVVFRGYDPGYGRLVDVQHANGYMTRYAHCDSIHVYVGDHVRSGQFVATVGSTGRSSGPHLHFEIRKDDIPMDPVPITYIH
mmetsp:Transcript_9142/g.33533  ORF Transcript_9142/g.33533 Transcript_9142/m.33533 type:complete len:298 (-) Transcript_9142:361-1254(-)